MVSRITIERILRDDDDSAGQNIRKWTIQVEAGFITLRPDNDSASFLLIKHAYPVNAHKH